MATFTDFARSFDDDMGFDDRPASDAHIFADLAVRADFDSRGDIRLRVNDGRRVNVQNLLLSIRLGRRFSLKKRIKLAKFQLTNPKAQINSNLQ
jgi:hypothetical protein